MIHSQTFTAQELSAIAGYLILKDEGVFEEKDLVVITVRNDEEADKKLTRVQVFFTITSVQTAENTRGIRQGYALVKLKRTKNPIPKTEAAEVADETETEA